MINNYFSKIMLTFYNACANFDSQVKFVNYFINLYHMLIFYNKKLVMNIQYQYSISTLYTDVDWI